MELVFAGQRERLIGGRIGDKSRETRDKRQRREVVLSALVINCCGRGFRSASFSSPNEILFEHFSKNARAELTACGGLLMLNALTAQELGRKTRFTRRSNVREFRVPS